MFTMGRVVAVGCCLAAWVFSNGPLQAQADKTQQDEWCQGLGNVPDDVQISACTMVIKSSPQDAPRLNTAYFYRGLTYAQTGRCRLAIPDFTAAIRYDAKDADAYWARHACKKELGDTAGAQADRKAAKAIDPRIEEQWDQ